MRAIINKKRNDLLPAIELLSDDFICIGSNKSRDIDVIMLRGVVQTLRRARILKHLMDM